MEESEINNFESEGEVLGELEELDLDDGLNKSRIIMQYIYQIFSIW